MKPKPPAGMHVNVAKKESAINFTTNAKKINRIELLTDAEVDRLLEAE